MLMSKHGKLYVGGLYICSTNMKYGYDVEPKHINLERDRQTVSNWDLQDITTKIWFDTGDM